MYCILVTGIPASGKSTIARQISEQLSIPVISKDLIKELLFDHVGFDSREEKVKLGNSSMEIMYYMAENLMKCSLPFILENNFEFTSKPGLERLLEKYPYNVITVTLTGDYEKIYQRFAERNQSPDRHRGHVVNDRYPEIDKNRVVAPIPYEWFVYGIKKRGMDKFCIDGKQIVVDTTDFSKVNFEEIMGRIQEFLG